MRRAAIDSECFIQEPNGSTPPATFSSASIAAAPPVVGFQIDDTATPGEPSASVSLRSA